MPASHIAGDSISPRRAPRADALGALVDLAFGELSLYGLTPETHTDNASPHQGGLHTRRHQPSACLHRGRRHDLAVHALLRPEGDELDRPRAWDV